MNTQRWRWLAAMALVAGLTVPLAAAAAAAKGKTHDLNATVVSVDKDAMTLTFKDDHGDQQTASVLQQAAAALATVKEGDRVVLTCQDDGAGHHEGIVAIRHPQT